MIKTNVPKWINNFIATAFLLSVVGSIFPDINKFNFGINGGVGIGQNLGFGNLFLDIKGYYGFLNIQKNPVNGKNNSGALVVSVGYAVKID